MKRNGFKLDGRTLRSVRYRLADEANRLRFLIMDSDRHKMLDNAPCDLIAAWLYISDAVKRIDRVLFF